MPVKLTYQVQVDTLRTGTFAGTYDDITSYVTNFTTNAGQLQGQTSYDLQNLVANPCYLTLQLDNRTGVFHQETLGSEVILNGNFATWSGGNPSSWTVTGEVGTNPEISQVDSYLGHGGGGTGSCNIYSTSATVSIAQTVLTVGTTYKLTFSITKLTTGTIALYNGATRIATFGSEGVFTLFFNATSTSFKIQNFTAACDVTIDDVSIKPTARYSGLLVPGVLVRLQATYAASTDTLFIGKVGEGGITYGVNQKAGSIEGVAVNITAEDAMKNLLDMEYAPQLETNITTGTLLYNMLSTPLIPLPYARSGWLLGVDGASELDASALLWDTTVGISVSGGQTTFEYAGYTADKKGQGVSAQQYIRDIMNAEGGGRFYWQPRNGTYGEWTFHDRHYDLTPATSVATIADTQCTAMEYAYGEDIANSITIKYTARKLGDPASILYTAKNVPIRVSAKSSTKFTGKYTDPTSTNGDKHIGGMDFQPLTAFDYSVYYDPDGGIPARDFTISAKPSATSVEFQVENNNILDIYITALQYKGTPLIWYDESITVNDAFSTYKYDSRPSKPLNLKMIDDAEFAKSLADFILARQKDPAAQFKSITFIANDSATLAGYVISRTIGNVITITNSFVNHNSQYMIIGEKHSYAQETGIHQVTYYVRHLGRDKFWALGYSGYSELGTTTRLAI